MSKFGSASLNLLVAGGVSLLPLKAKGLVSEYEALQDDTTGLGDAWAESLGTDMQRATLSLDEAFYTNELSPTSGLHDFFKDDGATSRVVCYAFEGDTIGQPFVGHQGAFSAKYKVLGKLGNLTKIKIDYVCSGPREEGIILQSTATKTSDWNTEGADSYDSGAGTSNGGSGYLQVTDFSGFSGFVLTFRDSTDDVTYANLVACSNVTAAPAAERVTVSGTVDRYLAIDGNVTGSGSITVFAGFMRHP